jgi:uncharacterized repeat protein (TIGR03847 family)
MADREYEYNPVRRITVGALGEPGHRTFVLQAEYEAELLNIKLEKQQVMALGQGISTVLHELEQQERQHISLLQEPAAAELELAAPVEPTLVAAQLALAYDPTSQRLLLAVEALGGDVESGELESVAVRLWAEPAQMRALGRLALDVVGRGRPICPLCQKPMDPAGHFCPRSNGHGTHALEE